MSRATRPESDPKPAYDEPIVGLSFYTDDPDDPIAGFGEQLRLPIPEEGETVTLASEDLDADAVDDRRAYRVVERRFEYRNVDYSGFSGEGRRQLIVVVDVGVEPVSTD